MSRAKWKNIINDNNLIQARSNVITPNFFNKQIKVHNGKDLKTVLITANHIGHKFGEFIFTKINAKYKVSDK